MILRLGHEIPKLSRSSKNVVYGNIEQKLDKRRVNPDRSYVLHSKKSNKYFPISPKNNNPVITYNNNISINEPYFHKSKRLGINNNVSFIMPKTNNNNLLHLNYLYMPKDNLNKSIASISNDILRTKSKISKQTAYRPSSRQSSKTNLKLVQKELQFKLLDMSMQIENGQSDDDDSNYFSNNKNDKVESKILAQNMKQELFKNKIKMNRSNSVNIADINKLNNLNSFYNFNKPGACNKCKTNKLGINGMNNNSFINITSFRNDLSKNNIVNKNNKRKSFCVNNINRSQNFNLLTNNNFTKTSILNKNNISMNKNNLSMNWNNRSMNLNRNNISMNKMLNANQAIIEMENKYRIVLKKKELYDSLEDEEVVEELEDEYFFINPETHKIFIFDTFVLFCNLFCCFYYPIYIGQSICFCIYIPRFIKDILFFTDIINFIDIILSFLRAYYNFEYTLIKKTERIILHYLKKYFFPDLIAAIPVFSCCHYLCENYKPDGDICALHGMEPKYIYLKMCLGLKIIKIFKILDKKTNRGIKYFYEIISENYTLEKTMKMFLFLMLCALFFNIFICYHIFIGRQSYPNWISATNNQNKDFYNLYMISCYFLITTMTSVGYGDITCVSLGETMFQIIVLAIGVIAYSWVVSTIGNYVKNETKAAIKFNKDMDLLEEIRISYPKMSFKLYNKIQKHLESVSHQQERFDTNLLVNNLPYTLKNKLMFIIYENIIKKFNFFKECENSDFILRILTSFIPLSAKKGAFIIHEGELVDNIIFVKEGRLSLIAAIDLDNPLISIDNYLGKKFEDINEKMDTKVDNSMIMNKSVNNIGQKMQKAQTEIRSLLKTKETLNDSNIKQEIGKCDFDGDEFDVGNHQFLNILDILKNEHYGEVYMFLQKPSPLSLRVKSKYSELFLLRKHEALQISKAYPNVWKKIYRKSYHNMKSIKNLTKRIVIHYCNNYGHKYDNNKGLDILRHDSDNFLLNLELLNKRKRDGGRNRNKTIKFNLEGNNNFNNNIIPGEFPKPHKTILKNKLERLKTIEANAMKEEESEMKSFLKETNINEPESSRSYKIKVNGLQMNKMKTLSQYARIDANENKKNDLYSKTATIKGNNQSLRNQINQINQINVNNIIKNSNKNIINNNIIINKISNNNIISRRVSKRISNNTINKHKKSNTNIVNGVNSKKNVLRNSNKFMHNRFSADSIKKNNIDDDDKTIDLNSSKISHANDNKNNNPFHKMHSNVAVRSNSLHFKNREKERIDSSLYSSIGKSLEKRKSLNSNFNDTKVIQGSNIKNTVLTQRVSESGEVAEKPKTIKNLSRPLLKKIQKKIKKRRKKKKLYKMLISKISESLIKLNPNSTILNSSMNNSYILNPRNDSNYLQIGYGLQNSYFLQDNSIISDRGDINEGLAQLNGFNGDLLIIPESPEFDSESSSENSKSSNSNSDSVSEKKKVELSISENTNFSYSSTYPNLNKISEGNYSKDANLQKSVTKLIGVYLKEKMKSRNRSSICKFDNPGLRSTSNVNHIIKKDKEKEKKLNKNKTLNNNKMNFKKDKIISNENKKENEEKDVWAFLNEDEEEKNKYNINLNSSKSNNKDKDSSLNENRVVSKTPKNGKIRKSADFLDIPKNKSRFNRNSLNMFYENHFQGESSPKSKKKGKKKSIKSRKGEIIKLKKCTTIIQPKQKKAFLRELSKSNKNNIYDSNSKAENTILSSLDLTINDNFEQQEHYFKNLYKIKNEEDDSRMDDASFSGLKK